MLAVTRSSRVSPSKVEVAHADRDRPLAACSVPRRAELHPRERHDVDAAVVVAREHELAQTIAIDIRDERIRRRLPDPHAGTVDETTMAVATQRRDVAQLRDDQIVRTIGIEVRAHHLEHLPAERDHGARREVAEAIAAAHVDLTGLRVRRDEVEDAIAVGIHEREVECLRLGTRPRKLEEPTLAVVAHRHDAFAGPADDDEIEIAIAVDIAELSVERCERQQVIDDGAEAPRLRTGRHRPHGGHRIDRARRFHLDDRRDLHGRWLSSLRLACAMGRTSGAEQHCEHHERRAAGVRHPAPGNAAPANSIRLPCRRRRASPGSMGRWLVLVSVACGAACADRDEADDAPRIEFLHFNSECFGSCGVTSTERSLRIEVFAGARPVDGPAEWLAAADSSHVVGSVDVALAAGEQTSIEFEDEIESSCSTSDDEMREVTVYIQLAGELFELTGDAYYGAGWGEC